MNIPYVVIGREIAPRRDGEQNDSYFAGDDSYQAGFLAGQCLAQNGHRRIGVVEWNGRVSSAVERDLWLLRRSARAGEAGRRHGGGIFQRFEHGRRLPHDEGAFCGAQSPQPCFSAITGMRRAACGIWQTRAIPSRTIFPLSWWARLCGQIYPARSITEYTSMRNGWAPRQGVFWWRRYGARQARFCAKKRHVCPCTLLEGTSVKRFDEMNIWIRHRPYRRGGKADEKAKVVNVYKTFAIF